MWFTRLRLIRSRLAKCSRMTTVTAARPLVKDAPYPFTIQNTGKRIRERIEVDGLGKTAIKPGSLKLLHFFIHHAGGERHNRRSVHPIKFAKHLQHLEAAVRFDVNIQKNDVWLGVKRIDPRQKIRTILKDDQIR